MKKPGLRILGIFLLVALCAASVALPLSARADNASVSFSFTPPPSSWFTSGAASGSVTATNTTDNITALTCTDTLSGTTVGGITPGLSVTASLTVSGDGIHSIECTATDEQGHTGSNTYVVRIDSTAPNIAYAGRTPANGNGWNNTDVTVTWTCSDDTSGPASGNVSQTVSSEGAGQSASASCTDNAGMCRRQIRSPASTLT